MKHSPRALVSLTAATLAMLGQGCSETPYMDTSTTEVTVTGVVNVKGKPASGGQIAFNPSNALRKVPPFTAPIGQDGSYTIKTYTGENTVTFGGDLAKAYPPLGVTRKYCVVSTGGQQQDFDLLSESANESPTLKEKMMLKGATRGKAGGASNRSK